MITGVICFFNSFLIEISMSVDKASSTQKSFKRGDVIIRQGDAAGSAYIIESGTVEIYLEHPDGNISNIGTRGPGSIVGEMAIVDNSTRVATIKALEECTMLEITREDFLRRLEGADPVIQMIAHVILTRYRDMLSRTKILEESVTYPPPEDLEKIFSLKADTVEYLKVASEFKEAINKKQLSLYYQPLVDFNTGEVNGFEALMRWIHPEKGFISPAVFIPIAEETGLVREASAWALEEACGALKRIERACGYGRDLHMSVNFSSTDFESDDFVDSVYFALSKTDVAAEKICLEITERMLMRQPEKAREKLDMCCEAGMTVAVDDFGTGYSSLSYLNAFPVQYLKVDRAFVSHVDKDEANYQLVKTIVSLGQNMNLWVIAEGVETKEEALILKEMGCDLAQGFYFARPLPESDVIAALKSWDAGSFF